MPSQRKSASAIQQQSAMRALYPDELKKGRDLFGNFFPEAAENIIRLATGFTYTRMNKKGEAVLVDRPPDLNANIYIINRFLGIPRSEIDPTLDRLNSARADFLENQLTIGFIEAQVKEILSRANIRQIEAEMWPKQFVTEEKQQEQLQSVATAMLAKLMALTPEEYKEVNDAHEDPGAALEAFKGRIGVTLAEVMEAVMGKTDDDEDEDEDEG